MKKPSFDEYPQLAQMRMGSDYKFTIKLKQFSVVLRPLSMDEFVNVTMETAEYLESLPPVARNRLSENTILAKKILVLASTSEPDMGDFKLTESLLGRMTNDEVSYLYNEYCVICDKVNPKLEELPIEEVDRLVDMVKKSPSQAIELSFLELVNVCRKLTQNG